jgi:hypothetical protein
MHKIVVISAGTDCRCTPQQLGSRIELDNASWVLNSSANQIIEHYELETDEDIGELIAVIVSIRHRQLTEQWYLEKVYVVTNSDETQHRKVYCFPCHSIVLARVTLRPGEGKNINMFHRQ